MQLIDMLNKYFVLPGVCVPYRCKDYSATWGGKLIGQRLSTAGQKATFECKKEYFMPNLTNAYSNGNQKSTRVICAKRPDKAVPVCILIP